MTRNLKGSYLSYLLAYFCFFLALGLFLSMMTVYLEGIGKNSGQIAFIMSASGVMTLGFQPLLGYLSDKTRSPRNVSAIATAISLIGGASYSFLRSDIALFIVYGITSAILMSVCLLMERIALKSPYDYGKIRSWGSFGYAAACQVSAIIYSAISPRATFVVFLIFAIISIALFFLMDESGNDESKDSTKKEDISVALVAKALITNKAYILFVLICFIFQGVSTTAATYFPLLIKATGGNVSTVGTALFISITFEVPVIMYSSKFFKLFKLKALMLIAFTVMLTRFAWYSTMPSANAIVYVFFFQAFSTMLFAMVTNHALLRLVKEEYFNTALSISAVVGRGFGVMFFQNILGQMLIERDLSFLYIALSLITLVGLVMAIFIPLDGHQEKRPLKLKALINRLKR